MGQPIISVMYDRNKRATSKKEASVELRITYMRKQKHIATGIRLLPKQWRNGRIVNRLDAFEMQNALDMFVTRARKIINDKMLDGSFDIDSIVGDISNYDKAASQRNVPSKMLVVDFMRERAEIRKFGKKDDTQERYDRFINFFEQWGGIVTFDDLTPQNIIRLDKALVAKNKRHPMSEPSRWHNYHRFLNSFVKDAIDEGLLKKNPYKSGLNIKKVECKGGIEKYLTREEFDAFAKVELPYEYLRHARDLFLFQTYTCMAYVDLAQFDTDNIRMVNGRPMYFADREKTGKTYSFLVVEPAMDLLKKYGGMIPMMCNQDYNKFIKMIVAMAGIKKPVTSHWARHTGATLLLNSGVDMEIVSRVLGHSSTKMTREVYAKMLDTTIADAMAKVRF